MARAEDVLGARRGGSEVSPCLRNCAPESFDVRRRSKPCYPLLATRSPSWPEARRAPWPWPDRSAQGWSARRTGARSRSSRARRPEARARRSAWPSWAFFVTYAAVDCSARAKGPSSVIGDVRPARPNPARSRAAHKAPEGRLLPGRSDRRRPRPRLERRRALRIDARQGRPWARACTGAAGRSRGPFARFREPPQRRHRSGREQEQWPRRPALARRRIGESERAWASSTAKRPPVAPEAIAPWRR